MTTPTLPAGFSQIPGGDFRGISIPSFGIKQTPVTNAEWRKTAQSLGPDRFLLLSHDPLTGKVSLVKKGKTPGSVVENLVSAASVNFERSGIIYLNRDDLKIDAAGNLALKESDELPPLEDDLSKIISGSLILLKMVDDPSAQYDEERRVFSAARQPVVGITYFHAMAWCLLNTLQGRGEFEYDLPTDEQYHYVASDRGTKRYGTETGELFEEKTGRKLAHIDEDLDGMGTTVAVDDSRYRQKLPFGVQTTGNVNRWIRFNPKFKVTDDGPSTVPFALRGGAWNDISSFGTSETPNLLHNLLPINYFNFVGFSPVVVRTDSKQRP